MFLKQLRKELEMNKQFIYERLIEAAVDVFKLISYAIIIIIFTSILKDDLVKYLGDIEKNKAVTDVALQLRNERLEASVKMVRSLNLFQHSTRIIIARLSDVESHPGFAIRSIRKFKEQADDFSNSMRAFMAHTTDQTVEEAILNCNKMMDNLLDRLDDGEVDTEGYNYIRRNALLLDYELSELNRILLTIPD